MFKAPAIFVSIDRRIRMKRGDQWVADSSRAMMLIAPGKHPVYYLPRADFTEAAFDLIAFNGPAHDLAPLADHFTVAWDAVRWFEEDEEILRHPRNPFVRVDCIATSRRVQVRLGGHVVADSGRAVFLFETGMITRHYLPIADVKPGVLRPSGLHTYCPYKGEASYHSVELDGKTYDNVVWFYPEPYDECRKIKGLVAFYNEKVDEVVIDGQPASNAFVPRL